MNKPELVAVPSRVFKTVSMIVVIIAGSADLVVTFLQALEVINIIDGKLLAGANAFVFLVVGIAKLVKQNIPLTALQKSEITEAIYESPTKPPKDLPPFDFNADTPTHG